MTSVRHFATLVSVVALQRFGDRWQTEINKLATSDSWSPDSFARVLLAWPDNESTWDFAQAAGNEVSDTYWAQKKAFHIDGGAETVNRAAGLYLKAGRSVDALEALHDRMKDITPDTIFSLLDAVVPELNEGRTIPNSMLPYELNHVFEVLQSRPELDRMEIARREYGLLPLIQHEDPPLVLHKLMSQNAELYVQILSDVFRADDSPGTDTSSESEINKARVAYSLLMEFKSVPGEDEGKIDAAAMQSWIHDVRRLAAEAKRSAIADTYIGHILAHSAPEASVWPSVPLSVVLEELQAPEIESGIKIERFNMRGVVTKAMYEGGRQEREIATMYRQWREARREYPRTVALLDDIARSWDNDAQYEDTRAQQDKLRS